MLTVQKIKSFFTRKGESKSAKAEESAAKMEKANNVDDTKDGNNNVVDQSVGKRTVWQRLRDELREMYFDYERIIFIGANILALVVAPSFFFLGIYLSPYFWIPFVLCYLIVIAIAALSAMDE